MPTVLVLNGPNLNMLGVREPEIYGHETLSDIEATCADHAESLGLSMDFRQSNSEAELIDWLHDARETAAGVIINPAAFTHTSVAIRDALSMIEAPIIELHLSNIYRREEFRKQSWVSGVATGIISGFGAAGYLLALDAMARLIAGEKK